MLAPADIGDLSPSAGVRALRREARRDTAGERREELAVDGLRLRMFAGTGAIVMRYSGRAPPHPPRACCGPQHKQSARCIADASGCEQRRCYRRIILNRHPKNGLHVHEHGTLSARDAVRREVVAAHPLARVALVHHRLLPKKRRGCRRLNRRSTGARRHGRQILLLVVAEVTCDLRQVRVRGVLVGHLDAPCRRPACRRDPLAAVPDDGVLPLEGLVQPPHDLGVGGSASGAAAGEVLADSAQR